MMIDLLKKGIYTGVGLGLMAKEKVEEVARQAAKDANLSEEEGKKFMDSVVEQSEAAAKGLEGKVRDKVNEVVAKMNLPSAQKIADLEARIIELEKKIDADKE